MADETAEGIGPPVADLYPADEESHGKIIGRWTAAFSAADGVRRDYEKDWDKYDAQYRGYVKVPKGEWRSAVFIPYTFSVIEGILPKMLAQMPEFVVYPVGPEDADAARWMEDLLRMSQEQTDFYLELTKAVRSSLRYGTGILKVFHLRDERSYFTPQPVMAPMPIGEEAVIDPDSGQPMRDLDGQPMTQPLMSDPVPTGEFQMGEQTYVAYDGPAIEFVDIRNFWVAPEAIDIESARYVIQRTYKELSEVQELIDEGIYRLPPGVDSIEPTSTEEEPLNRIQSAIGKGSTVMADPSRKPIEILEFWTDEGEVLTIANRRLLLRYEMNPFWHQSKPFVRTCDYLQEGEFYGVGECESIEGLQDLANVIINQRVDNVRLSLNKMLAVNQDGIEDERSLVSRPGNIIQVKADLDPRAVIFPIEFNDVTSSAYQESLEIERLIERVTGVSAYTVGMEGSNTQETATGVALIQEAGNTKFGQKVRLLELLALRPMAKMFGSIFQQFTTEERLVRIKGPVGELLFKNLAPDSIQGGLDFDVRTESTVQTESVRKDQAMQLLNSVGQAWPLAVPKLVEDLLRSFGKVNIADYLQGSLGVDTTLMLMAMQQQAVGGGMGGANEAENPEEEGGEQEEEAPMPGPPMAGPPMAGAMMGP